MQFRFREYDKEHQKYNLITFIDIDDYDTFFKTLTFMKDHKCEYPIEVNMNGVIESIEVENYEVKNISLCISKNTDIDRLIPCFVVDIEET